MATSRSRRPGGNDDRGSSGSRPGSDPKSNRGGASRGGSASGDGGGRSQRTGRESLQKSPAPKSGGSGAPRARQGAAGNQERGKLSRSPDRDPSKGRSRSMAGQWRRDDLSAVERTAVQAEYDGPPLPEHITGAEIDKSVSNQLKSLPEKLAVRVARHLVAAGELIDSDPEVAYEHTLAARGRAARVSVVREASGEAAYAAGRFREALTEFKAARRMSGSSIYLPMMADCERALGRPERALSLTRDPAVIDLDEAGQIEMKIVESGARRDLGEYSAAIRTLEGRELRSRSRSSWAPRLRYAYAEALLADGQVDAAHEWFERAAGVDTDGYTDAAERVAQLEGLEIIDTLDTDDKAVDQDDAS